MGQTREPVLVETLVAEPAVERFFRPTMVTLSLSVCRSARQYLRVGGATEIPPTQTSCLHQAAYAAAEWQGRTLPPDGQAGVLSAPDLHGRRQPRCQARGMGALSTTTNVLTEPFGAKPLTKRSARSSGELQSQCPTRSYRSHRSGFTQAPCLSSRYQKQDSRRWIRPTSLPKRISIL